LLWSGLLLGGQATDTLTTALDRAQGALEMMPVSAQVLEVGGVALFWVIKLLIVASAAAALLAAAVKARAPHLAHHVSRLTGGGPGGNDLPRGYLHQQPGAAELDPGLAP